MKRIKILLLSLLLPSLSLAAIGPSHGSLVIVGGGQVGPEILKQIVDLAGGTNAPAVVIPTADDKEPNLDPKSTILAKAGFTHVTVLHTRDRAVADTEEFVKPLKTARAVWFVGGRQWRLVDSYLHTRTEKEIHKLLARGGVVAGSSAGATIQGSYLVRGAREGNTLMMAPGYEQGFDLLHKAAIDQHLITRHRENDLLQVIDAHPDLLGIGIDESTAIVVHGDRFDVIGKSKVAIYDPRYQPQADGKRYYFLSAGDSFDLKRRKPIPKS